MMKDSRKTATVLLGAVLVAIASISFINEKQKNSNSNRCIFVEGYAEREINADKADWTMCFEHIGTDQLELEQRNSEEKLIVNKFLIDQGISQNEIEMYNYVKEDYRYRHNDNVNEPVKYRVGYFVHVKTDKLNLVANLKNNISKYIGGNFGLVKNSLRVFYSKQEEVNQELARLAADNAMKRAKDLTSFLKVKLKKIMIIEAPNFWNQSKFPEIDSMNGIMLKSMAVSAAAPNTAENNASEAMTKQKAQASIKLKIAIK
ncbi:MAG: SIMPL domain-containing protein [Alphaproteobacteria bacterium]|nr:SIMPL domain-containing protein [Alphaproteobacteria bacterium]